MAEKTYTYIPAELKSASVGGVVVSAEGVYDYLLNKNQQEINQDQKEMNQNTIQWDPDEENFFRIDKQGNKVIINGDLARVVVNYLKEDTELGDEFTEFIVTNIKEGDLLGDTYVSGDEFNEYKTEISQTLEGAGKVDDVKINNTSQLNNKEVNLAVEGTYNSSSNKLASMNAVKNIPNDETFINNLKNNNTFNDYITNKVQNESSGGTLTDVKISSDGQNWTSLLGSDNYSTSALLQTKGAYSSSNKLLTDSDVNPSISGTSLTINGKTVNLPTTGGAPGKSAYEIAEDNGFSGTVQEWLASLKGADGTSISIKTDANSCTNLGDAYIDGSGNLQILTSLDPRTFTNSGQIRGPKGTSITTIEKTSTSGLVDTYTITLDNGDTETFTVTNGAGGTVNPNDITTAVSNYFTNSPTINNATITSLTTNKIVKNINPGDNNPTYNTSTQSVTINASNGDLYIINITTSITNGVTITNATIGQNITVILVNEANSDLQVELVNDSNYKWNGGSSLGGQVNLTSPVGGYCEISFLCYASGKFYVRGV